MRLVDLNPHWVGAGGEGVTRHGQPMPERDGVAVEFDCPCGACGIRCLVPFDNPVDGLGPWDPARSLWRRTGDTFETLTLTPSILRTPPYGCGWHGFITNGAVTSC